MKPLLIASLLLSTCLIARAQSNNDVVVDKQGIMRWSKTNEEVKGFGVNYTVPFAHAYRTAKKNNLNIEKIIDDDVYHFARLGFDAYRVHVWDTEISDTLGNLLVNDHLRLFDYLLFKLKERGIKSLITPIAFWGNGWPEPDEKTPGFAAKFGKGDCLTNLDAIKAQENYLTQFLNHVNQYTGIAYKDDPDIIAFEVSNEPHHGESPEKVTTFIKRMIAAMRKSGTKKPIFYNISHSIHLAEAYFDAGIQGGTFQWYPTGLGARHELEGNVLPHVEKYRIPFANNPKFKKIAKVVYEFDAADVGRSYIYPAMARSFREAGMQWATHFAYDPTYMASTNTEYGTHYMNLPYTPQKALSLMLASEVFHSVPMYKNYGGYPANTVFDGFKVNYGNDLAELVTEKKFIHTNTTASRPSAPDKLEQIAGSGNSSVIKYEGTGAYFLDKVEPGVWRLEVMPDAIWIQDPFTRTSPTKELTVINYRTWPIEVTLSDLGENFTIQTLNDGNTLNATVSGRSFDIRPGTYLLKKAGAITRSTSNDRWKNIVLKEFVAPTQSLKQTLVLHKPIGEATAGNPVTINATIVTPETPEWVEVSIWGTRGEKVKMERVQGYEYSAIIPVSALQPGMIRYFITVFEKGKRTTFPQNVPVGTSDWDFYEDASYTLRVVAAGSPVYLFNAATDNDGVIRQWTRGSGLIPLAEPGKAELQVRVEKLHIPDPENRNGEKIYDFSFQYPFSKKIEARRVDWLAGKQLVLRGRTLSGNSSKIQVSFITEDGSAFGATFTLDSKTADYRMALGQLKKVKPVTLPRPYPTFLPYYFENKSSELFDLSKVETIQFSIGPGLSETERELPQAIAIESIRIEQ